MGARLRRKPAPASVQTVGISAPIGGINSTDAASSMPPTDSIYCYNLVAAEYGLRSRLGYREWCTGLDGEVRSVVPFTGSKVNGSADRLFACTSTGIWDVSASSASPTQVMTFPLATADSGWGVSCVMVTQAGHFLLYADEEHGLYVYSETNASWVRPALAASTAWASGTVYAAGARVSSAGVSYVTSAGGTSGSTAPTGTGTGISDGAVLWDYSPSISGVDPANCAFVTAWKNRVWLVEKNTTKAYYLGVNAILGAATAFNFGSRFASGGPLVGLWNSTGDGGQGPEDRLVAISSSGDVVVYEGTDPATPGAFGIVGSWSVGGVPNSRRIASSFGGDVLILSTIGVVPLTRLTQGNPVFDRAMAATAKIANLFNVAAAAGKTFRQWAIRLHPTDNTLLVCVPTGASTPTTQFAMSFANRSWSQYRDLPIYSSEVWGGSLYFGTTDGRVCVNTDYVDNVQLSNPNTYTPVQWSVLTAFQDLDNGRQKQIQSIRSTVISQGAAPVFQVAAKFNFDLNEVAAVSQTGAASGSTWDTARWDAATSIWAGTYSGSQTIAGATGIGTSVAIAMRGTALARTTVVGWDVVLQQGGFL